MTETAEEHDRANRQKFDRWAGHFDDWGFAFRYFQKRVLSLMVLRKNSSFLDLGCGTGWAVCRVASMLEGQGHFVGVDLSEKMIEKAAENSKDLTHVRFHAASAEALPLEDASFDNILCTFSFHHYLNPGKALSEARRVLKPGGKIYILDGTPDDFFTRWIDQMAAGIDKGHVKQYSSGEFARMFSDAGLQRLESRTILIYPVKVHIAKK